MQPPLSELDLRCLRQLAGDGAAHNPLTLSAAMGSGFMPLQLTDVMHRLHGAGLTEMLTESVGGRVSVTYRITDKGRARLAESP